MAQQLTMTGMAAGQVRERIRGLGVEQHHPGDMARVGSSVSLHVYPASRVPDENVWATTSCGMTCGTG